MVLSLFIFILVHKFNLKLETVHHKNTRKIKTSCPLILRKIVTIVPLYPKILQY